MRLGRAIAAHGWGAFTTEILELCEIDLLNKAECKWIADLCTLSPNGFNLTAGGNQLVRISDETRDALSKSQKGKVISEKTKTKLREAGLNRSEEYRRKISQANNARIYTPELVQKIGSGNRGRTLSESHRAKISASGLNRSPTTLGMKHTDEAKAKISAAHKGKKHTKERIEKAVANKAANRLLRQNASIAATSDLFP